jgi:hypothetical protein
MLASAFHEVTSRLQVTALILADNCKIAPRIHVRGIKAVLLCFRLDDERLAASHNLLMR